MHARPAPPTPLPHFLLQAKRTAMCVALANCDLCVLNSYDLRAVMKDFPNSARQLEVCVGGGGEGGRRGARAAAGGAWGKGVRGGAQASCVFVRAAWHSTDEAATPPGGGQPHP